MEPLKAYKNYEHLLKKPWPDILIASGRSTAPVAAAIHKKSRRAGNQKPFVIVIQDPRLKTAHFDAVIAPRHADVIGDNVITTHGSLHPLTHAKLEAAKNLFPELAQLKGPRLTVLIGGENPYYSYKERAMRDLIQHLERAHHEGYSLMISCSRRTPPLLRTKLEEAFSKKPQVVFYGGHGAKNPYLAFLAYADKVLVTGDSVSMITEACFTGKNVFIYKLPSKQLRTPRLERFHHLLFNAKKAAPFEGDLSPFENEPLDDLTYVKEALIQKLQAHFCT